MNRSGHRRRTPSRHVWILAVLIVTLAWTPLGCQELGGEGRSDEPAATSDPQATVPDKPSDLSAEATSARHVRVTWTDESDNESGFWVTDGEKTVKVPFNATSYTWTVEPGTEKCTRVQAYNKSGASDWTDWVCVTTPGSSATATTKKPTASKTTTTAGPQVDHYEVSVWGNDERGTYVTELHMGDIVEFTAYGTWGCGGTLSDGSPAIGGPDGIRDPYDFEVNECLSSSPLGTLFGYQIDGLVKVEIGSGTQWEECIDGKLYLVMNDRRGYYGDNSGMVTVYVDVTRK